MTSDLCQSARTAVPAIWRSACTRGAGNPFRIRRMRGNGLRELAFLIYRFEKVLMSELLNAIDSPDDLRKLERTQLPLLAQELREFLVESVARTGGHLSSNLGTVELTIALALHLQHAMTGWCGCGHQTMAQDTHRTREAMSRLPRRAASPVSPSARKAPTTPSVPDIPALRFRPHRYGGGGASVGSARRAVAIIGDGAMTGAWRFEALNNAGALDANCW